MKHFLYHPLHVAGKNGVVSLCPEVVLEDQSIFDQKNIFYNKNPKDVPFMVIGSKFHDTYRTEEIIDIFDRYVKHLDVRKDLKNTAHGESDYMVMVLCDLKLDSFRRKMNRAETAQLRKEIYKCMSCVNALINIDGLLFNIIRKNGDVQFELCEVKDEERVHFFTVGTQMPGYFFKGKSAADAAAQANYKKYPMLESVVFQAWPTPLEVVEYSAYTGKVEKLAMIDLAKKPKSP